MRPKWKDLGLTYEEALHGMQSGVKFSMNDPDNSAVTPKHLRTGINASMVEHSALVFLLLDKGIITEKEYFESLRLAMNHELARYEAIFGVQFR